MSCHDIVGDRQLRGGRRRRIAVAGRQPDRLIALAGHPRAPGARANAIGTADADATGRGDAGGSEASPGDTGGSKARGWDTGGSDGATGADDVGALKLVNFGQSSCRQ